MIGCITAEGVAESNKAAHMAAGDSARPGVPSAATGVGAYQDASLRPSERPPIGAVEGRPADPVRAGDYRRPYIEAGHAVQSPANAPGLASQSAPVSELAMTAVGRRP